MFKITSIAALALALGAGAGCDNQEAQGRRQALIAADNTGANRRDRQAPTAQAAGLGTSDVDIMAAIRRRVVDDGSLSTNAHNVKIVAQDGTVTLRGPVGSASERTAIERIAVDVVGAPNVVNQLEVAP